jgi:hypothetical protein
MGEGRHRARIRAARVIETVAASGARFALPLAGARRGIACAPSGIARRAALTPPIACDGVSPRLAAGSAAPRAALVHLPPGAAAASGVPA